MLQTDGLDETIARFNDQIQEYCHPFEDAVGLLDTIPGAARHIAEVIVSEIGVDMSRFPNANPLSSWAGVAPGKNESGENCFSGKTTKSDQALISAYYRRFA